MQTDYLPVDPDKCLAVKSKGAHVQCTRARKGGLYCGLHTGKNVILYDTLLPGQPAAEVPAAASAAPAPPPPILSDAPAVPATSTSIDVEVAPEVLGRVIMMQSNIRRWLVRRRTDTVNQEDIYTCEPLVDIPAGQYFRLADGKLGFGFDTVTFWRIIDNTADPINPYTNRLIDEAVIIRFMKRYPKKSEPAPKLSAEQKINDKALKLFQKIDALGNYTDYRWLTDMSYERLRNFYGIMRDIWQYRTGNSFTLERKKSVVHDGRVFDLRGSLLPKGHRLLLQIVMDEIERMISEGKTPNDQKMGAMLLLTGLVEASPAAASALPHFVQNF